MNVVNSMIYDHMRDELRRKNLSASFEVSIMSEYY